MFDQVMARTASTFRRVERRSRGPRLPGLLSSVERKNCWRLAEQAGLARLGPIQRLVLTVGAGAMWRASASQRCRDIQLCVECGPPRLGRSCRLVDLLCPGREAATSVPFLVPGREFAATQRDVHTPAAPSKGSTDPRCLGSTTQSLTARLASARITRSFRSLRVGWFPARPDRAARSTSATTVWPRATGPAYTSAVLFAEGQVAVHPQPVISRDRPLLEPPVMRVHLHTPVVLHLPVASLQPRCQTHSVP